MPVHRVAEFDLWRPGYAGATVRVNLAGTTTPVSLFSDESLQIAIANPQTLDTMALGGILYGKFLSTVYTSSPYELDIDGQQTGIERPPITTLVGVNASKATVVAEGGSQAIELEDIVARVVHAQDYGEMSTTVSATTDATLTAAIGAAAANAGGVVKVPAGTYPFNDLSLPAGVVLEGAGRGATVLTSQTADDVITLSGSRAGLRALTLDGLTLVASSVGVFAKSQDEIVLDDVEVRRFVSGLHWKGGRRSNFTNLYIDNCATAAKFHGDNDAGGGADGDEFRNNRWVGGKVSNCTLVGVELSYEDKLCSHNEINDVGFEDNTGKAVRLNGPRFTTLEGCWWRGNTTNLEVLDDADTSVTDNTVIGLHIVDADMSGGAVTIDDTAQDIVFERTNLASVAFTLTTVANAVLFRDTIEDSAVTISGDGTKIVRERSITKGASTGTTSDATATKAWSVELAPGQAVFARAMVLANGNNIVKYAHYHKVAKAHRPGSTLDYDAQTVDFTLGQTLTGATSGATALVVADSDSGATGTLTLRNIVGEFENNETITDGAGGSATADGTLTAGNVAIDQADTLGTDHEDTAGYVAAFVANGSELELQVTGAASEGLDWRVFVEVTTL